MNGLIGIKVGMTRFFTREGSAVPVTVIKIEPHRITQVKTLKKDGYCAIQITTGIRKKLSRITKSELGHYAKSGVDIGRGLWEFRPNCDSDEPIESFYIGQVITVSLFNTVRKVDVTGISKGKGFSGTVKRWNFSSQDATHGNSLSHRAPGSIGQNQTPGKVFKGKKMSGQLGNVQVTIQNLDIVSVDLDHNLLFVKGSIPGEISDTVRVKISKKLLGVALKKL